MTDINARIAEKKGWNETNYPVISDNCEVVFLWKSPDKDVYLDPPQYTTDWRLAGELLEEMKAELCYLKMSEYWLCTIRAPYIRHNADTPQMAIALAWLEWRPTPPEGE